MSLTEHDVRQFSLMFAIRKCSKKEACKPASRRYSPALPCPGGAMARPILSSVSLQRHLRRRSAAPRQVSEPSAAALSRFFVPFHAYHWPVRHFYNAQNPQNRRPQGPDRPYFSTEGKNMILVYFGWPSRLAKWRKKALGSVSRGAFLACFRYPF